MGSRGADSARYVRDSVMTTEAAGTARLRYVAGMHSALPELVDAVAMKHPTAGAALRLLGRAARRAVPERSSSLPGPDGVIDFTNHRVMYSHGAFWQLIADGQDYSGHPGEWYVGPADTVSEQNPFWLVSLLTATVEVTTGADETIRGVRCRRYDALADFDHARRTTTLALAAPLDRAHSELSRLPVQIWVDDSSGLIREAVYWGEDQAQTRIQLSEHGVPDFCRGTKGSRSRDTRTLRPRGSCIAQTTT